ncbi:MAG: TetR/AcrR family transcriptional regulator, ethionamide resistance regulator [Solirubrobacteraceae bacterium]|jgi:AcrR family transcriptional regulator|nr:TetR/AcrR family transcriptional regulator, ethionamide resistance regulator [Solirubrobacteraceae bacterium]MEA2318246.1 TetR/AcrR family transcriptional regulator, ethionamide resistance regulator [Solirubrobacteraceae bacterium]
MIYAGPVGTVEPSGEGSTAKRVAVQAAVLEATGALLEEAPYADLNIERIARRAGISRTAFYFYFHDKREVLMRLARDVAERLYGEAGVWFSAQGDAVPELREALRRLAALYDQHGAVLRAVAEGATSDEQIAAFWNGMIDRLIAGTRTRIEAEQQAGRADVADAGATAFALCWMTERSFHQQFVQDRPVTTDALVTALGEIWVRGVYGSTPAGVA